MDEDKGLLDKSVEDKIIQILSKRILSTSKLAKELGIKRYILVGYLEAMKNQGKLEFHKVGKANVYTLAKGERK
jgi:Mn-dependent DtxR family transcriptional regulator